MKRNFAMILAAVGSLSVASIASAELAYGLVGAAAGGSLITFDTASPGAATIVGSLSGIPQGHSVRAIDFRPANGLLYALSTNATTGYNIYTVNLSTAALTLVGGGTATTNFPARVSMDFNPVADRIRVVSSTNQNLRINPATGALVATDTNLAYAAGDANFGSAIFASGVAYTNNFAGSTSTTMYVWDYNLDNLLTVGNVGGTPNSPNTGLGFTVGAASIITSTAGMGFDISSQSGVAYLQHDLSGGGVDQLSTVNLATGLTTTVGTFGGLDVLDISIVIPEPSSIGLLAVPALALVRRRRA